MNKPSSDRVGPFHAGEQAVQARLGVREQMADIGRRAIRKFMPEQHQRFFEQLPFMLVGSSDRRGRPWASVLVGRPGFVQAPSATRLNFHARPIVGDPLSEGLVPGAALGFLGIELHTRRRNRVNGHVVEVTDAEDTGQAGHAHFSLDVDQSLGNCPQYIQGREFEWTRDPQDVRPRETVALTALDGPARAAIEQADTLFVATRAPGSAGGADVSHRGGRAGFVKVEDDRTFVVPDFAGNAFFMTLGNLQVDARAGVLFIDFETGDLLTFTGTAEVIWDGDILQGFEGAERAWRFHIQSGWRLREALPLRWKFRDWSAQTLATGQWRVEKAADVRTPHQELPRSTSVWRRWRVTKVVDESQVIRSFHLTPADGLPRPAFRAGQHLPIRLRTAGGAELRRTYTISSAPEDAELRLSVKREGEASSYLHDRWQVGDVVEALAPQGRFVIDAGAPRPAVLIGAGVGMTPMVAFARHLIAQGNRHPPMRPVHLIQVARDEASRAFGAELQALAEQADGALRLHVVLSHTDGAPTAAHQGPLTLPMLQQWLPLDDYEFFLCGPGGFMQALYDGLRDLGIRDERIQAEAFGPSALRRRVARVEGAAAGQQGPSNQAGMDALASGATSIGSDREAPLLRPPAQRATVVFKQTGREAAWQPADGTLLDFAEQQGLAPPFSCRAGHCGSCATRMTSGEVTYARPIAWQPAADEVLLCCAVPSEGAGTRIELAL
ncbi:pyridoxamine 5'-phosphate oxidase family protein [Roseateles terrae]|uniref:FAD-binding oxidoreductase n=1 Tax=Roseateles terrae TaxID=431060 RepID=A0ABR6GXM8_9BURK|nr:pyridoxamine 5'-phosphate oxidase family protein [Roseateles terrae]MBB3196860.1 hypothetical protein [Roseateles terrae]OWQ84584.1 hypothetical protein CDN98_18965 [Roseateles terrae]